MYDFTLRIPSSISCGAQPRGKTQGGSSPPIYDGGHKSVGTKLLRKIPTSVRLIRVQFSERNAQVEVHRQGVAGLYLGATENTINADPVGGPMILHAPQGSVHSALCTTGVVVVKRSKGGMERAAQRRK